LVFRGGHFQIFCPVFEGGKIITEVSVDHFERGILGEGRWNSETSEVPYKFIICQICKLVEPILKRYIHAVIIMVEYHFIVLLEDAIPEYQVILAFIRFVILQNEIIKGLESVTALVNCVHFQIEVSLVHGGVANLQGEYNDAEYHQ
jgi:hypothetical protein